MRIIKYSGIMVPASTIALVFALKEEESAD
jgi:hypothetical protein